MKPRICVSLVEPTIEQLCKAAVEAEQGGADLVELRIDHLRELEESKRVSEVLSSIKIPAILTCRPLRAGGGFWGRERTRVSLLRSLCSEGFEYVDIEHDVKNLLDLVTEVRDQGVKVILSFHDFQATPKLRKLQKIAKKLDSYHPDIIKVVTYARYVEDNLTCLRVVSIPVYRERLICFAAGVLGKPSRVLAPLFGAPFTYASLEKGKEAAPGQLTLEELREVYRILGAVSE